MASRTPAELYEFIRHSHHAVIATAGSGGPEAALMDIAVTPELEIIFETTDATRKIRNMQDDSRVAFVINWENNRTLQYEGVVDEPLGREQERIIGHFFSVFPNKLSHRHWPGNHYFRVRARWIRYSDYNSPRLVEEHHFPPASDEASKTPSSTFAGLKRLLGLKARRPETSFAP
jgi:hypothetical protein